MAADRIKGITIEIGGDTSKLADSLKDVNKEIKDTQSALKDVNKLLKLDPGNIDLLKQKQGYLKDEISATAKKLETEKEALKQLKANNSTGEVTEEQKRLEREIADTEQSLKSLKKEYKDFGGVATQVIRNAGENMKSFGDSMTNVGKNMSMGITAPIVALGTASVAAFNEVDAGLDIVAMKTGATGDALTGLQEIVKNIATTVPADFQTVGNAVGEVSTRFGLTGTELEDLSTLFIQFAAINNTDVVTAVDNTQKALSAFGLDATSADALLNTLTATAQATGASVDSLTNGLIQNGTAFQEMGLTVDQSVVAMGMMETSGANAETVMQGLRKALKNATEDGIPLNDALINLQNTILDDTSATGGLTAAYDMFGKSGDQIYAAVKNGTLDFAALATEAENAGDTIVTTFNNTLDPTDQATVAINSAKVAGAELGNTLLTVAAPVIQQVTALIQNLTAWFKNLSPETQENIVKIAALAAAIGPVIAVVGSLISGLGSLVAAFNPVTLVIGAVIAAGTALYLNWDKVCAFARQLWSTLQSIFGAIGTFITGIWGNIASFTDAAWTTVTSIVSNAWNGLLNTASNIWNGIKSAIMNPIEAARDFVGGAIDKIRGFFNFDWSLPKLKLPHVTISGSFSLFPPSIPSFGIQWYKKAYENPVMFNQPTVVPTASGYKGFGDGNGSEVVIGMSKLQELVGSAGNTYAPTINIYQQPGEDTDALARRIQDTFVRWTQEEQGARGIA